MRLTCSLWGAFWGSWRICWWSVSTIRSLMTNASAFWRNAELDRCQVTTDRDRGPDRSVAPPTKPSCGTALGGSPDGAGAADHSGLPATSHFDGGPNEMLYRHFKLHASGGLRRKESGAVRQHRLAIPDVGRERSELSRDEHHDVELSQVLRAMGRLAEAESQLRRAVTI